MFVTLYSFAQSGNLYSVYYDTDNPTYINYNLIGTYVGTLPPPTAGTQVGAPYCLGTDKYVYKAQIAIPYANYTLELNSPYCGYTPPACDIVEVSYSVTDETDIVANNGSVNMFAVSSFGGIIYYLFNADLSVDLSNTTGYFTNLAPDTYTIKAQDLNGCSVQETAIVSPFDNTKTHYKYRLLTPNIDGTITWECRLLDMRNNYLIADYPIDLKGGETPIYISQKLNEEDKTSAFAVKTVDIQLHYDQTFATDEFNLAQERQWKCELYKNGVLEFQGWILPDQTQDYYQDAPYSYTLQATDGIPSLKGNSWGDGSGGNGYSASQIPQYGLTEYMRLIKQCLDQLGYNYGDVIIASSLRFNNTYNANIWRNMATWSDILYSSEGEPIKTYDALEKLVKGMRLCLLQHRDKFVLCNWNDLSYLGNGLKLDEYIKSFYELDLYFSGTGSINQIGIGNQVEQPVLNQVGFDWPIKPTNPVQPLNYDKAYNIKGKVDFDLLALLYTNPSFEVGAVEGELPINWGVHGSTLNAYLHNTLEAYEGEWVFRLQWINELSLQYVELLDAGYYIDQPNKVANISIKWREGNHPPLPDDDNITIAYRVIFKVQSSGNVYIFAEGANFEDGIPKWIPYTASIFSNSKQRVTDYIAWNSYSQSTTAFPEDGLGYLNVWLNAPQNLNPNNDFTGVGMNMIIDYDIFELSINDANEAYSKQTGETHSVNSINGIPQANTKELSLDFFTYPNNKRIAGNIFTQLPYIDGLVQNKWNYALKTLDSQDRLPAAIVRSIARNYGRPMYIYEGDFKSDYVQFYSMFKLRFYENKIFMPMSLELDCRMGIGKLTLYEVSDEDIQAQYTYRAIYEKSARKNVNN